MIDPIKHKFLRYILFFNLYFAEGLMIAITTVVTALYLREQGISIPITTLIVGIVNIPWILKFIWGPIVDHFIKFGRRTFIIFGGLLSVIAMFLASMVNPGASLILVDTVAYVSTSLPNPYLAFLILSLIAHGREIIKIDGLSGRDDHHPHTEMQPSNHKRRSRAQ